MNSKNIEVKSNKKQYSDLVAKLYQDDFQKRYEDKLGLTAAKIPVLSKEGGYSGNYDTVNICRQINLYTYWQGRKYLQSNMDKGVRYLLVAQDWGNPFDLWNPVIKNILQINSGKDITYLEGISDEVLKKNYVTDYHLIELFKELGYEDIRNQQYEDLFFTNFCLGYRTGKISGDMTKTIMRKDADFFVELCDILRPKNILCLGTLTYECVLDAFKEYVKESDVKSAFLKKKHEMKVFHLSHTGVYGTMNRNKLANDVEKIELQKDKLYCQKRDWKWVKSNSIPG